MVASPSVKANGHQVKGPGLNHQALLSDTALRRPQSAIRGLFPVEKEPGMISFLAGKPHPGTYPFEEITIKLKADASGSKGGKTSLTIDGMQLETALQYGMTPGMPELVQWLKGWQSAMHHRRQVNTGDAISGGHNPWTLNVGQGSQDLLAKTFHALLNVGDCCLIEKPAYAGILPEIQAQGAEMVAVESDALGLMASSLRDVLSNWTSSPITAHLRFPKFVYTTPTGANPSGYTQSEERKVEVLQVIREFGLLLLEDDPYILLSFEGLDDGPAESRKRPRTYFDLEQDEAEKWGTGLVIRFDSFSKVLSAGMRMGFATGSALILHHVESETAVSNLTPSGLSQVVVYKLLDYWGHAGLLQQGDRVARFYRTRRDNAEAKARKILGCDPAKQQKAVATWVTPVAGMFLWLRLKLPPTSEAPEGDSFALIKEKARKRGVLAVPGMSFYPDMGVSCYVRTSFSLIPEEDVEEGFRRLRSVIEDSWKEANLALPD